MEFITHVKNINGFKKIGGANRMKDLISSPQNIVVIGDMYVSTDVMVESLEKSKINCGKITQLFWGDYDKTHFAENQQNLENHGSDTAPIAEGLEEAIVDADIVMTHFSPIPKYIIEKGKNLKLILTSRGGVEHINVKEASNHNIPVFNVIRNAEPVADFALGLMLDITRNITLSDKFIRNGQWMHEYYNTGQIKLFNGHLVGLVGIGNVGAAIARRLNALGVSIIAYDSFVSEERLAQQGLGFIKKVETMEDVFKKADIVSLHLRLTPETEGIINEDYFKLMKKTAYFINTARGGLIDEDALITSLQKGYFKGAALDVVKKEPIPSDSPLIKMDNVLLTSHIAGMSEDAVPKSPFLLMAELDRYFETGVTNRIVNEKDLEA